MKSTGKKISGRKVFTYVFLTIAALISLFPFYFMFVSATNTNAEILSAAPKLFFGSHLAENFANLNKKMDLVRILTNSTIMTVSYTALAIVLHSMAGYALAKFEFKGKGLLFGLIMITMMIPAQVMYVPLFTLMNNIGWANTVSGSGASRSCGGLWYLPDAAEYAGISNLPDRGGQNRRLWGDRHFFEGCASLPETCGGCARDLYVYEYVEQLYVAFDHPQYKIHV